MKQRGFTVIELLIVIVLLGVGAWVFFSERIDLQGTQNDQYRKTAINAMYYDLEEVYYPKHHYYPATIDSKVLRAMDPSLFSDPYGIELGSEGSDYRYEATGCSTSGHCTGYTLRSSMDREADYIKTNRSHTDN